MEALFEIAGIGINIIDIVIFVFSMLCAVLCCFSGLAMELSKWGGIILGILAGIAFNEAGQSVVRVILGEDKSALTIAIVSFVIIFFVVFIFIVMMGLLLKKIFNLLYMGVLDHILGFVFGLAVSTLVFGSIVYLLSVQTLFDMTIVLESSALVSKIFIPLFSAENFTLVDSLVTSSLGNTENLTQGIETFSGSVRDLAQQGLESVNAL